jgi:His-Xaa-Ser system protein HxsD
VTESDESAAVASPQQAGLTVRFSTRIFDIETIKKAAYRLGGYCTFDFAIDGDDVVCTLHRFAKPAVPLATELTDAFRTEVLDQDLRRIIGAETAPIRNAVLAYAFSRTGLQEGD